MNIEQRNKVVEDIFKNLNNLMNSKGAEYSRSQDVLANFKRGEEIGVTAKQKLMIYASKHWDSILSYIKNNEVKSSEPIEGRIFDLINYMILLKCLIEEENTKTPAPESSNDKSWEPYFIPESSHSMRP